MFTHALRWFGFRVIFFFPFPGVPVAPSGPSIPATHFLHVPAETGLTDELVTRGVQEHMSTRMVPAACPYSCLYVGFMHISLHMFTRVPKRMACTHVYMHVCTHVCAHVYAHVYILHVPLETGLSDMHLAHCAHVVSAQAWVQACV